jgi:hypothetical protein
LVYITGYCAEVKISEFPWRSDMSNQPDRNGIIRVQHGFNIPWFGGAFEVMMTIMRERITVGLQNPDGLEYEQMISDFRQRILESQELPLP